MKFNSILVATIMAVPALAAPTPGKEWLTSLFSSKKGDCKDPDCFLTDANSAIKENFLQRIAKLSNYAGEDAHTLNLYIARVVPPKSAKGYAFPHSSFLRNMEVTFLSGDDSGNRIEISEEGKGAKVIKESAPERLERLKRGHRIVKYPLQFGLYEAEEMMRNGRKGDEKKTKLFSAALAHRAGQSEPNFCFEMEGEMELSCVGAWTGELSKGSMNLIWPEVSTQLLQKMMNPKNEE